MRRNPVFLFWILMVQLTVSVGIGIAKIFPDAPTKAFGNGWIGQIVYSPNGEILAVSGSEGVFLYDPQTLTEVGHLAAEFGVVRTIAFSPDGIRLASGGIDATVRLWNLATSQQIATFTKHSSQVTSVAISPDGTFLASSSTDGTVRLWDLQKRIQVADLNAMQLVGAQPGEVRFHPAGNLIAVATNGGKILLWDVETTTVTHIMDHQAIFPSIAFTSDGKTLLSIRGELKFWNVETGKMDGVIRGTRNGSVVTIPNRDQIVSFGSIGPVQVWDVATKEQLLELPINPVDAFAFHPTGDRFAIVSGGTTLQIWDIPTRQPLRKKETHTGSTWSIAISPNGRLLASGQTDNTIRLWDIQQGTEVARLMGHTSVPRVLAFSSTGELLASGDLTTVHLWDVAEGRELLRFPGGQINGMVFSPDSQRLITVNDVHTLAIWDIDGANQIGMLQGNDGNARGGITTALAMRPDGKLLASGGISKEVYLWNVDPPGRKTVFRAHQNSISSLAFSPDGQMLASGDGGGTLILWDVEKKEKVASYQESHRLESLTFSPDGQYLLWMTTLQGKEIKSRITAFQWREGKAVESFTVDGLGFFDDFALSDDGRRLITLGEKLLLWDVNFPSLAVEPTQKQLTFWGTVKRTALLQNFPNPFNPETWMPYTLGVESDVTILIYNLSGQKVRTLPLGRQPARDYLTRNSAAYWDGRNDRGEPVASGVYLYELRAGAYREKRKMVLMK